MSTYTKADLERIVFTQLENLNAFNDLIVIMKKQNELLAKANKKLSEEMLEIKRKCVVYPKSKRSSPIE